MKIPICLTHRKAMVVFVLFVFATIGFSMAQSVLNGDFSSGTANWGCTPELNPETVYGGSNGANVVAEIDNLVSLCQTISGFTIGSVYDLRYAASRRLGGCPGPLPADIAVTMATLSTIDSRSNSVWAMTTSTFQFTATANSHTLNIVHQFPAYTTCGFIIDDFAISLAIPFGVELSGFEVEQGLDGGVDVWWKTQSEHDLRAFLVEKSTDGMNWTLLEVVDPVGDAQNGGEYKILDGSGRSGVTFYRLQSVDNAGAMQVLGIRQLTLRQSTSLLAFPNPCSGRLSVKHFAMENDRFEWIDPLGKVTELKPIGFEGQHVVFDLSGYKSGVYVLRVGFGNQRFTQKISLINP